MEFLFCCRCAFLESWHEGRGVSVGDVVFDLVYGLTISIAYIFFPVFFLRLCYLSRVLICFGSPCFSVRSALGSLEYISQLLVAVWLTGHSTIVYYAG